MKLLKTVSSAAGLLLLLAAAACRPDNNAGNQEAPGAGLSDRPPTAAGEGQRGDYKPGFAEDYLSTNRGIWQKPEIVIDLLGDLSGKTVADIGAGTGFFAFRLTPRAKRVIAIDIDPRFIEYLDSAKARELPANVQSRLETRLAEPDDPHLGPNEADVVLIVNTYMYIKDRVAYLVKLRNNLAPGGMLLIVDFKKKRTPLGPPSELRIPLFQAEEELYQAGYRNIQTNDTSLDYQYIITAEK